MLLRISSGAKSRRVSHVPASSPTTSRPACVSGSTATPPAAPRPMTTTSVGLSLDIFYGHHHRELTALRLTIEDVSPRGAGQKDTALAKRSRALRFSTIRGAASLVAITLASAAIERGRRLVEHAPVVRRSMIRHHGGAHLLLAGRDGGAHARIADQIPADEAGVAAVVGVAKRALHGVSAHERKELRGVARERRAGAAGRAALEIDEHGVLIGCRQRGEGGPA